MLRLVALTLAAVVVAYGVKAQTGYKTYTPAGAGPFPAVLFVSGCSGFVAAGSVNTFDEKAEELRKDGYVVVFVDYIGKSGVRDCSSGMTPERAVGYLLEAATWARQQKNVDPSRISALGWSYGGGVILGAQARMPAHSAFAKSVLFYPFCAIVTQKVRVTIPTLLLLGGQDTVAPPAQCAKVTTMLPAGAARSFTYASAYHGFDQRGLPPKAQYAFGTVGYSAEADKAAWSEAKAFLK